MAINKAPPAPIPVTLLTGFLGAGKTTLLNRLAQEESLKDAVILVNEFGEIGLDHLLIEKVDGDMILMASGCLCCTIRGDLVTALEDLLRRRDNGRIAPFRRVIIETTGLADPAPILQTLMTHPYLVLRYRLDGVITAIDAINGAETLLRYKEAQKQAAVADRLVITKSDLLQSATEKSAWMDLDKELKALNPFALRLDAARGEADAAHIFNAGLFDPELKKPLLNAWLGDIGLGDTKLGDARHCGEGELHAGHSHDEAHHSHHDHMHDRNRHSDAIRAFCLTRDAPVAPQAFALFLDLLRHAHGPKLLRVKGVIALSDDPQRPIVIHGAQHSFHPPVRLDAWPDADHRTRIVVITDGLREEFVDGLFAAAIGEPRPDTPDAQALRDNPLSIAPRGLL